MQSPHKLKHCSQLLQELSPDALLTGARRLDGALSECGSGSCAVGQVEFEPEIYLVQRLVWQHFRCDFHDSRGIRCSWSAPQW